MINDLFRPLLLVLLGIAATSVPTRLVQAATHATNPFVQATSDDDRTAYQTLPAELDDEDTQPPPLTANESILRDRLLRLAEKYEKMSYVPYIWGGDAIGSRSTCEACRRCVLKKGTRLKRRQRACQACRRCGSDCSHFVHRLYREAGLPYPYVATSPLLHASDRTIRQRFNLINLGSDPRLARPGDLLLTRRHIVILLRLRSGGRGDIIHITRLGDKHRMGGIGVLRDIKLSTFRGRLLKIFRHKLFFPGDSLDRLSSKGGRLRPEAVNHFMVRGWWQRTKFF